MAEVREVNCQFWALNTNLLLAMTAENWIQENRISVVVLPIVLWISLAFCQDQLRKEMNRLLIDLVAVHI